MKKRIRALLLLPPLAAGTLLIGAAHVLFLSSAEIDPYLPLFLASAGYVSLACPPATMLMLYLLEKDPYGVIK